MWQLFYELEGTVERVAARAQRGVDDTVRGAIAVGERGVVFVGREYSLTTARFDCVYTAYEDALPRAWTELAKRFSDIELDQVLHNLFDALEKMVVAILGRMTTGAAIGGAAGAFAGGVGAVPGAIGGAAVGLDVAMEALYVMGLAEVADYVVHALPEALRLYGRGLQEAWNAPRDPLSGVQRPDYARQHHVSVATGLIADAHERMVVLILMGLVACLLAKFGAEALAKTLGEGTLGEDFANWFMRNAAKIRAKADLQPRNWMPRTAPADPPPTGEATSTTAADLGGAPGRKVLSGHGGYEGGETIVPKGTSITVYSEHGATISDGLGNLVETGGDVSNVYNKTFGPGEAIQNYTLYPPDGLNIMGGQTVSAPTKLSDLLQPDMGEVHWAACTYDAGSPASNIMYHTDGIYQQSVDPAGNTFWSQVKIYGGGKP